jgi:hypothetical protein
LKNSRTPTIANDILSSQISRSQASVCLTPPCESEDIMVCIFHEKIDVVPSPNHFAAHRRCLGRTVRLFAPRCLPSRSNRFVLDPKPQ